jgi:2-amino-4-hydroxy-6-hydroxymethyldihydropteridine diphosphokinase
MAEALLALGGNVGDVRTTFDRVVVMLCDGGDVRHEVRHEVRLLARSSDYRTPPWGVTDQPAFINCGLRIATSLSPRALLERAQAVETALGRNRGKELRWGPRAIDIDLIAYDDVRCAEPDLTLPHPRALERAFVMVPLAEIAPDRVIGGTTIAAALARLDAKGIEKLPPR